MNIDKTNILIISMIKYEISTLAYTLINDIIFEIAFISSHHDRVLFSYVQKHSEVFNWFCIFFFNSNYSNVSGNYFMGT